MMHKTLISFLERAISRYLALDSETLKRLAVLSGKAIKITLTDWQTVFYLFPSAAGLAIQEQANQKPDAEIKGTLFELIRIRFSDQKTSNTLAKKLEIKGDIHLAQTFNHILQQIEIDWEEYLSAFTGDIVAHRIGTFARGFKRWGLQTKKSMGLNITEYLQEESGQLPTREEIEDFFSDIAKLQQDVMRLEAKLKISASQT